MVRCLSLLYFHGPRRLCVEERAVWSVVYLYDVFMVVGGFEWWSEQCGPLSLSIIFPWS